jgi:hypothetical protein
MLLTFAALLGLIIVLAVDTFRTRRDENDPIRLARRRHHAFMRFLRAIRRAREH